MLGLVLGPVPVSVSRPVPGLVSRPVPRLVSRSVRGSVSRPDLGLALRPVEEICTGTSPNPELKLNMKSLAK